MSIVGKGVAVHAENGSVKLVDACNGTVYGKRLLINGAEMPFSIKEENGGITATTDLSEELTVTVFYEIGGDDAVYETVTVENRSRYTAEKSVDVRFEMDPAELTDLRICDVPFRRCTENGELRDWPAEIFKERLHWYSTARNPFYSRRAADSEYAEGWAFYYKCQDTTRTLLVSKYNPVELEWSAVGENREKTALLFGGATVGKMGLPNGGACFKRASKFFFGKTRYTAVDGDYLAAYSDYRRFTERMGHGLPENYSPDTVWNELYDNPYWFSFPQNGEFWHNDLSEYLDRYYRRSDMEAEAQKAAAHRCSCLYLDPGWDTAFGSNIWDEKRMGDMRSFAGEIKERYGLSLGLHAPLAPWTGNSSFPEKFRMADWQGNRKNNLCVANREYIEEKVRRVKNLYTNGARFFLFDGSWFEGPCCCSDHGHSVPSTVKEHVDAIRQISARIHQTCPDAVIEQHDPVTGPGTPRFTPVYFLNGNAGDPDEIWGFEFMNEPLEDLLTGRAASLYYYNLAYSVPVYLHIDLRRGNGNCLMFWWFASTCRHLGFGGTHGNPETERKILDACAVYDRYRRFFSRGDFFGLGEDCHCHTLAEERKTLVNIFNLTLYDTEKTVTVCPEDTGLGPGRPATVSLSLGPLSHALFEIDCKDETPVVTRII